MTKDEMKNEYSAFISKISEILGLGKPIDILKLCATTDLFFKPLEERIIELEKEITELKQAKAIAQLNLDNSRLSIENERLHKENIALKEIKELFSRLNKEQSEAILELKMRIEEMESSSKHWDEIHRGSKIMGLDTTNELKTQKQLIRAKAIIKEMLSILPKENIEGIYEITEEAEQFLNSKEAQ